MTETRIDTGTDHLLAELRDGVAVLTMNRPERRNALSGEMLDALARMLEWAETDDAVGCVLLTGAGGAFCAGGDVKAMNDANRSGGGGSWDVALHRQRLSQRATAGRLHEMAKPTVAAIGGPAAGAGLSLALACDLRYATPGAILTTAFARVGFAGDYGGTWFLTRLVGPAKARELYFFSPRIDAAEGERLGIVNAVIDAEDFTGAVLDRARQLAGGPRLALRYMKENLNRAIFGPLDECLDMEAAWHLHTGRTADHRAAVAAFVNKQEPTFEGRY